MHKTQASHTDTFFVCRADTGLCPTVVYRKRPSKDVYALIPTTSERLVTWQMGTKVADGIKVANWLPSR